MSKSESRDLEFIILASLILFAVCFMVALRMLPEYCNLFDDNIPGPFTRHTIPMPADCEPCENRAAASFIAAAGIGLFFFPFLFMG